ncbi:DUF7289 family protein [Natrarchaeobius chitinivorans]|uniref:Flagellin n=1 Tax=Natrarchaeobius chitinivorans TaxID=1679083 RepID=A0A3N6M5K1_NATCH|nr:hypothetical protein [Natrarchaeobius chitinivorans]RQG95834.1 hypothetical protein EA473_06500 [Natrarchaeobius chitinivorans]
MATGGISEEERNYTGPDDRSQSEIIGFVLILGFTMIAATAMLFVGLNVVDGHEQTVEIGAAENELALFGSKVSEVALGDSSVQSVSTESKGGSYEVTESTGTMEIKHINRTGAGTEETIHEFEMGEVTYEDGGTKIAYQGGGVWRHEDGHTTMVSPPEFHYRYGTLTLPVVNVTRDNHVSGQVRSITARQTGETNRIYPNSSRTYENDDTKYENPIENGTVEITVESEYYQGWKAYFEERTGGNVSYDDEAGTATVELLTLGDHGHTEIEDGEPIIIRAAEEEEPMNDFNLTLYSDDPSGLNNLDWALEIDGREAVHLHAQGSGDVDVTITDPDDEDWEWEAIDVFEVEDTGDSHTLHANLSTLDGDKNATHVESGEEKELGIVFDELIERQRPNVDLTVEDKDGAQRVNHDESSLYIDYEGVGFVTYLQITENEVKVRLN